MKYQRDDILFIDILKLRLKHKTEKKIIGKIEINLSNFIIVHKDFHPVSNKLEN
jgi:hypothetical protein